MALTWTVVKKRRLGPLKINTGHVAFDDHYPGDTSGYAVTASQVGLNQDVEVMIFGAAAGFVPVFNDATDKVQVYYCDYDAGADGALIECAHPTDLSTLTAVPFIAFGR